VKKLITMAGPRVQAALLLALVAAAGMLAGIAVERLFAGPAPTAEGPDWLNVERPSEPPPPDRAWRARIRPRMSAFYVEHLTHELDLSAEQQDRVERILATQQERMREITREIEPRFREVAEATRRDILDILDEDQRRVFRLQRPAHGVERGGRRIFIGPGRGRPDRHH
jgi:hypothetical protein